MVDDATSDEDKVTPVYKLEEICDLLRSSHPSIVKEVSHFILKRLDHKSPIVKQKVSIYYSLSFFLSPQLLIVIFFREIETFLLDCCLICYRW